MPATRSSQSPYPNGPGFVTVPVLFSLPNVQPAIAAANTGVRQDASNQEAGPSAAPPNAVPFQPTVVAGVRAEPTLKKWTSQLTNITIVLLLVAVVGLAYRNQPQVSEGKLSLETAEISPSRLEGPGIPPAPAQVIADESIRVPETALEIAPSRPSAKEETEAVALAPPPILLAPPPQQPVQDRADQTANDRVPPPTSGPYGTPATPFSLTSSKSPAETSQPDTMETETPSLNTRDIIKLRNGQRRGDGGGSDPDLPKVESMARSPGRSSSPSAGGTPIMAGQSYPRIAPQYEPISMPTVTSGNPRITQPSPNESQKPPQKQYVPLSPVLPNPNQVNDFDGGNP